ncbi:MAG: glycogen synthase GlgA [Acetobacteraceae bacterium]
MSVLSVASEIYPLIKTGGLADVAGALPAALAQDGVQVRSLVPGYPAVLAGMAAGETVHEFVALFGGTARLIAGTAHGLSVLVLDAPHLFARPGDPYRDAEGRDWPDNAFRFAALARAATVLGHGVVPKLTPDIIHAHDWQAGLVPAFLHYDDLPRPKTVMTVHNMAFQGKFPADLLAPLGLPAAAFAIDGVEYYGSIGFLKAGLQLADWVTTVSPTYAAEIQSPAAGMGLDGLMRARADHLSGILNGIDVAVWNPAHDPLIKARFGPLRLGQKAANKAALQERYDLAASPGALLFGVVSRLSWQKGLDLLLAALPALLAAGAQLAVLGTGESTLESRLAAAGAAHRGRIGAVFGFEEELAHQIQAGCDAILVPSRFEPCGLTQLCALRYGAVPVVARAGGLTDTIIDANEMALAAGCATGIQFAPGNVATLADGIRRTACLFRSPSAWRKMQTKGMATDVSWRRPASRYAALYRELVARGTGEHGKETER